MKETKRQGRMHEKDGVTWEERGRGEEGRRVCGATVGRLTGLCSGSAADAERRGGGEEEGEGWESVVDDGCPLSAPRSGPAGRRGSTSAAECAAHTGEAVEGEGDEGRGQRERHDDARVRELADPLRLSLNESLMEGLVGVVRVDRVWPTAPGAVDCVHPPPRPLSSFPCLIAVDDSQAASDDVAEQGSGALESAEPEEQVIVGEVGEEVMG